MYKTRLCYEFCELNHFAIITAESRTVNEFFSQDGDGSLAALINKAIAELITAKNCMNDSNNLHKP